MKVGTRLRAKRDLLTGVTEGDLGTFVFGADYVPGWDAGRWEVRLDKPATRHGTRLAVSTHWTLAELLNAWEEVT
jgi:hypothetical protein